LPRSTYPQGDSAAVAETAKLLVNAESPVLVADIMARTQDGMDRLVELAELLQCAVIDQGGRTNFPSHHPLNQSGSRGAVARADVIVGLELNDFWGLTHSTSDRIVRKWSSITKPGAKKISISTHEQFTKANDQEFQRFPDLDLAISGDGEETLPYLIEAVKQLIDGDKRNAFDGRGKKLAAAQQAALQQLKVEASTGWDNSPITTARLCAEIYEQIRTEDWSLVGEGLGMQWPRRLWHADKRYRFNGGSGGAGIGYSVSAALGAGLANRKYGRLNVAIQSDGDLMFSPGALWTAAHHKIPILYVMHNNRAYHMEYMYVQNMAGRLGRGVQNAHIGTTLTDPFIDYAGMAKSFGLYSEGPISDPSQLAPALKRAIAAVKRGQPALLDTIVEAR
jgi:acetolactate synthase-1/2/3 large subunit